MVLNRNPENHFAGAEQAAFSPGSFVPGVAASPDGMLQGRVFSYHDTHRHRLGPNYWPNSFGGPAPDPPLVVPPVDVAGMAACRSGSSSARA